MIAPSQYLYLIVPLRKACLKTSMNVDSVIAQTERILLNSLSSDHVVCTGWKSCIQNPTAFFSDLNSEGEKKITRRSKWCYLLGLQTGGKKLPALYLCAQGSEKTEWSVQKYLCSNHACVCLQKPHVLKKLHTWVFSSCLFPCGFLDLHFQRMQ